MPPLDQPRPLHECETTLPLPRLPRDAEGTGFHEERDRVRSPACETISDASSLFWLDMSLVLLE